MAYTLGQLVTDVRNKLDDSNFDATLIKEFINDAQRYLVNKHRFKFMEGTYSGDLTIDQFSYDLPSGVAEVETFRITDPANEEIDITGNYLNYKEFDSQFPDVLADDNGEPHWWTIREGNFLVYPKPDQAYTIDIRYQKDPTALSADADVPDVPERYKELLVLGALVRAHKFNDNYDLAQAEQVMLEEQILDVVARTYTRQTGRPHIMRANGRRA